MPKHSIRPTKQSVKVLSTVGVQGLLEQLAPEFERATGYKLTISFNVTTLFKKQIEAGENFDLGIFTNFVTDDLIKSGMMVADTRTDIARSGIGLSVRAGAPKPNISTVTSFKRALLAAQSIVYPKEGISGIYFAEILKTLGIDDEMESTTILDTSGGLVAERVASGEAEYAVQLVSELVPVRGIDIVGTVPSELQHHVVLTGAISTNARSADAAKLLLEFLTAPHAILIMKAKGLEPV